MGAAREILTWDQFGEASRDLARQVVESGFEPDIVLSITRGGLLPAGAIAYALDNKNIHIINVEFYTGVDERCRSRCSSRPCRRRTTWPTAPC